MPITRRFAGNDFQSCNAMVIRIDDLRRPEVIRLLDDHLCSLRAVSPPESCHALDLDGLRKPDVVFWTIWIGDELAGCGALKELDSKHGEIKSMRTVDAYRRKGVARRVLQHIIEEAGRRGYRQLSLETGSMEFFEPARQLYSSFGFTFCRPFADYVDDPNSVFMTKEI
jgi:putative acetyltransferase